MSALATVAVFLALMAQTQGQAPTFRGTTRLVELSVTALDKKGNGVTDPRREDFTVEENGRPLWKPAPDAVSLRIIVRDLTTGKYGTLDVPLKKLPPANN